MFTLDWKFSDLAWAIGKTISDDVVSLSKTIVGGAAILAILAGASVNWRVIRKRKATVA